MSYKNKKAININRRSITEQVVTRNYERMSTLKPQKIKSSTLLLGAQSFFIVTLHYTATRIIFMRYFF